MKVHRDRKRCIIHRKRRGLDFTFLFSIITKKIGDVKFIFERLKTLQTHLTTFPQYAILTSEIQGRKKYDTGTKE